ncbi:hypothetical protein RJ641_001904 [Dillenia turbinata]|uniref:Pentatricopeptide repeat-containing protein n=1 Tax=Dillenia turbinata TaxID=194707 RepID=A0AAN8ZEZ0_9MAGN
MGRPKNGSWNFTALKAEEAEGKLLCCRRKENKVHSWLELSSKSVMAIQCGNSNCFRFFSGELYQRNDVAALEFGYWNCKISLAKRATKFLVFDGSLSKRLPFLTPQSTITCKDECATQSSESHSNDVEKRLKKKKAKKEYHLWKKRDSAGSGQKALNLIRILSGVSNEKDAVYGALDKWTAWETEFPLIAASKALNILRKRSQWRRVIQVAKWMLSKGQGTTMGTYDTLLLAFDMDRRVDEAESLWSMILHAHTRSVSKRLFSRMISLYDHHNMQEKIIQVFADMEELGVKPDEDTVRRVACAFQELGQEDKQHLVLKKYQSKWKYIHFKGERVRVRRDAWVP